MLNSSNNSISIPPALLYRFSSIAPETSASLLLVTTEESKETITSSEIEDSVEFLEISASAGITANKEDADVTTMSKKSRLQKSQTPSGKIVTMLTFDSLHPDWQDVTRLAKWSL